MTTSPYWMRLDLRILEHLGIKLYSNAAAVLSEAVANAWDADATKVEITSASHSFQIDDDGVGMDLQDINDRFLNVGYDKREHEGDRSKNGRHFMGRKGIGKLSLFSIADEVDVHTVKAGERHAFRMQTSAIKRAIKAGKEYRPLPIPFDVSKKKGTKLVLRKLKRRRTATQISGLRKRIARRFSIIGYQRGTDSFDVILDGAPIAASDREDLRTIEFLWEFGTKKRIPAKSCPSLRKRFVLSGDLNAGGKGWTVRGWIGAAARPTHLRHPEAGAMNGLVVLARGRLIQENILDKLGFNRLFANYVTGQIDADFLDVAGEEDIATSDRQRLIEDDERYIALTAFLRNTLNEISEGWTELRNETRGKEAMEQNPALGEWIDTLPQGQQQPATRLLGLIQGVELEEETERRDLYRAGITAFERLRLREESHRLSELDYLSAAKLLPLLVDLEALEGSLYREIVRSRLDVIKRFENLVDGNSKERVLQEHLFQNLWLLDPGWERAATSARVEQRLKKEYKVFADDLSDAESKGRIDIRYRTNGGQHIIVELKRAKRVMRVPELMEQGQKYLAALTKCLETQGERHPHVSIVFVLGRKVAEAESVTLGGTEYVMGALDRLHARVVYYDELIENARNAYREYLEKSATTDRLEELLQRLEAKPSSE